MRWRQIDLIIIVISAGVVLLEIWVTNWGAGSVHVLRRIALFIVDLMLLYFWFQAKRTAMAVLAVLRALGVAGYIIALALGLSGSTAFLAASASGNAMLVGAWDLLVFVYLLIRLWQTRSLTVVK